MKYFIKYFVLFILFSNLAFSQNNWIINPLYRLINFQSGGFVTAVFPAYNNSGNINQQYLYAKTDVGGVYFSYDNGNSWMQASNYYVNYPYENKAQISFSEYVIAGLAVHPKDPGKFIVAWGDFIEDAQYANYNCLWKTTSYGCSFDQRVSVASPGVWFQGDIFERKIGGECIIYDPRPIRDPDYQYLYMGGISPITSYGPKLFKSIDGGTSFSPISDQIFSIDVDDTIKCITMHKNSNQIWVGTTKAVYRSTINQSNGDPDVFTRVLYQPSAPNYLYARRILLKPQSNMAFVAYGITTDGGGIWKTTDNGSNWQISNYDQNLSYPAERQYFCNLSWADANETILLGARINQPFCRKSTDFGVTWIGEVDDWNNTGNIIHLVYSTNSGDKIKFPNHQSTNEGASYMYTGMNNITRNPNTNLSQYFYCSGGAGLRQSDNVTNLNSIHSAGWRYSTFGQSMPVIYDIVFEPGIYGSNGHVFFPMSDWTMGWKQGVFWDFNPLQYDDRVATNGGTTWISNVSRDLISLHSTTISYIVGGDLYSGSGYARMGLRNASNSTITQISSHQLFSEPQRFICDGTIFDYFENPEILDDPNSNPNNLIVTYPDCITILVGSEQETTPTSGPNLGIFFSTNQGVSFNPSNFDIPSDNSQINTSDQYQNSVLPGYNGNIQGMFDSQFNLAKGPGNNIYLYLKNGGVFKSTNYGQNWQSLSSPLTNYGAGCLKYVGDLSSGYLVIALKGLGVKKGIINSSGDVTNWSTIGDFTDASQVEVHNNSNNWAVFGKRPLDNQNRLYKSIGSENNWSLITGRIRGVRSLRIQPDNSKNLWIATTGLGVIVYSHMAIGTPIIVYDNVIINQNSYFEEDIVVDSSGSLTIEGNINVNFAPGKKIHVNEGGKLNINGATFNSLDSSQQWGGIEVENCDSSLTIQNCTFNNATLPIKITNDETTAYSEKIIKNNVFNCESTQDFTVYAENVFNILIQGNHFNMAGEGSQTVGLEVKNNGDYICEETTPKINIVNNTFTDGCASMVLNSYASELSPVYVYGNTFTGSSATYNIIGRMITGTIKNNNFSGTGTDNPVYLQQCTPDMFGNVINGSGTTMILNGHSYPNLSPVRTSNTYYWYGGRNKLYSTNAGNINVIDAGLPLINYGHNQFSKNSDPLYFHIAGALDSTVETYSAAKNAWCNSGANPVNYLYTSGNPFIITDFSENYSCNQLPAVQYTGSVITDMGFGINDTLFTSSYTNNYIPPDELLYSQASVYVSGGQFLDAINSYKFLINNHTVSDYLNTSLYDMFDCYQNLDTSENTTYRDNLYSDLKTYLNDKIQSNNYNSEFIDIAYYLINMCEVNMENYNDALTGFEFIAMFHPDATMRLLASWDYDEVQDLMGQSGAEKEVKKEVTAEKFRKKVLSEIENAMKNDSTMRVVSRMFKQQNEEINSIYSDRTTTSKSGNENTGKIKTDNESKKDNASKEYGKRQKINLISKEVREDLMQRAENNLRALRTMNTERKIKKHKEDILLIAGLTVATEKKIETTSLPLSYSLSQNYPNPFNPVTKINYELPFDGKVKLMIYDVLGREIKTLVNEVKQAGKYTVEFNGSNFASGVYFYRIEAGKFTDVKRMVLVK